jgi:solute carrier family 45 protein 1/2/4
MTQSASLALEPSSSHSQHEWVGRASVRGGGPRWLKLVYVTVSMIGLQLVWSTEMAYGECPVYGGRVWPDLIWALKRPRTCCRSASQSQPCQPSSLPVPCQVRLHCLSLYHVCNVFTTPPSPGLIVQPLIGTYADRCRLSIGRRRPFIIGGCIVCVFALMLLGFTKEIAAIFARRGNRAVS